MATPRKRPSELKIRKSEDIPPLTVAQQGLAVAYLSLAESMAGHETRRRPRMRDDWFEAAYVGLVLAAESFDATRSDNFANHAILIIKARFRNVRQSDRPLGYRVRPGGAPLILPFDGRCRMLSREPAPDARLLSAERRAERRESVARLLARLTSLQARILVGSYLEGKPHARLAAELGICRSSLRGHRDRAMVELRETA